MLYGKNENQETPEIDRKHPVNKAPSFNDLPLLKTGKMQSI